MAHVSLKNQADSTISYFSRFLWGPFNA